MFEFLVLLAAVLILVPVLRGARRQMRLSAMMQSADDLARMEMEEE